MPITESPFNQNTILRLNTALLIVFIITALRVIYLWIFPLPLFGDEAQYWTWAQQIDWGYYSKPPMVAWMIHLTTLLGDANSTAWIRFASPVAHGCTAVVLAVLARYMYNQHVAAWTALLYITLPAVFLSSLLISTDPFLLLFWSLAMLWMWQGLHTNLLRYWLFAGLAVGFGLLSKYSMVVLPLSLAIYMIVAKKACWQEWLIVILTALLCLMPNLYWNAAHGWLTFMHTGDNANLGANLFNPDKALEFFLSQFGVFGPLPFAAFLAVLWQLRRRQTDTRTLFLVCCSLPLLLLIQAQGFISRANANWAAPALTSASILAVVWMLKHRPRWPGWSVLLSSSLAVTLLLIAALNVNLPSALDPFKRLRGSDLLADIIRPLLQQYPDAWLLTDHRMRTAELLYQLRDMPVKIVKWNNDHRIDDHYELTTHLSQNTAQQYLFITQDPASPVLPHFRKQHQLPTITIATHKDRILTYYVTLAGGLITQADLPPEKQGTPSPEK